MIRRSLLFLLFFVSITAHAQVIATTSFLTDITQNIAGNAVTVTSLLPVGTDPHLYEPVPEDVKKLADAEVIIKNGLHLEGWLDKVITNSGTKALICDASFGVDAISAGNFANSYDPHAWMSVVNGKRYAHNIEQTLASKFPQFKQTFEQNLAIYLKKLDELDLYIQNKIYQIPENQRILITSHDAFRYYGRRYGVKVESILGTSTDAEVRLEDINRLIKTIESSGVPAIFMESTINPKLMNQIAADHGVKIGGKLYADSLGPKDSGAETYLDMLKQNTDVLVEALMNRKKGIAVQLLQNSFILGLLIALGLIFWYMANLLKRKSAANLGSEFELNAKNLTVAYDSVPVFSHLNLTLKSGRIYGLIGPNGSGKSTLVKSLIGLQKADTGEVLINGKRIEDLGPVIGYVPQKDEIDFTFPATVHDVVMTGRYPMLGMFKQPTEIDKQSVDAVMERLQISHLKHRPIGGLSGGQQQRAFVARALVQNAPFLILDEPFVGIDATTEARIIELLKEEAQSGKLILIIHHDLSKVEAYFDDIIMMNRRIVAMGPVSEIYNQANVEAAFSAPGHFFMAAQTMMKP